VKPSQCFVGPRYTYSPSSTLGVVRFDPSWNEESIVDSCSVFGVRCSVFGVRWRGSRFVDVIIVDSVMYVNHSVDQSLPVTSRRTLPTARNGSTEPLVQRCDEPYP